MLQQVQTILEAHDPQAHRTVLEVAKARNSNLKHRPVGLGIMGFQDCLHLLQHPYASDGAMAFADRSMEAVCYYAYWASTELAEERGRYASYKGSLWERGIMPQDSLKLLRDERGGYVEIDESVTMDWSSLTRARRLLQSIATDSSTST